MTMIVLNGHEIRGAAELIRAGGLVAMPTETVYGLAADATNDRAVARIFEAKGRPQFNPLIVHVADAAMAKELADFPPLAVRLAAAFWPGPLTLVLARRAGSPVSLLATAGLDTIALRAPDNANAQALLGAVARPLAAPSANRSGAISPTTADHVREGLGGSILILDGGPCRIGVESTIVRVDGDGATLLRAGGATVEEIERVAGAKVARTASGAIQAPGMLASHYAPTAPLRMNAASPRADEAFLAFGAPAGSGLALTLSATGDLAEAAANLFAHLRALDRLCAERGLIGIAAAPVPQTGLGEAINDRLTRASASRGAC